MIRIVLGVAAIALAVTAVAAQSDPIAARRALMKANGDQAKIGTAMAKGEAPFDAAKAQTIFATFADAAAKAPALFPDNSKTGGDTAALPAIWENKADFDARLAKFGTDAKAAQSKVKDLDTFKATWGGLLKDNCGGCHEKYRQKKS
jgi:cytochrome c556